MKELHVKCPWCEHAEDIDMPETAALISSDKEEGKKESIVLKVTCLECSREFGLTAPVGYIFREKTTEELAEALVQHFVNYFLGPRDAHVSPREALESFREAYGKKP